MPYLRNDSVKIRPPVAPRKCFAIDPFRSAQGKDCCFTRFASPRLPLFVGDRRNSAFHCFGPRGQIFVMSEPPPVKKSPRARSGGKNAVPPPVGKIVPALTAFEGKTGDLVLFQSITEEAKIQFFRLQGKRRAEKEYWAYDSTSISSRSEMLKQVKYRKNKDEDHLPQINLALVFGEESKLPFYYRKIAGNMPDVKTVRELLRELDVLGYEKVKLVIDRGYYSKDNINALYKNHLKFLSGTSSALSFAKAFIREIGQKKDHYEYYNSNLELYVFSKTIAWDK